MERNIKWLVLPDAHGRQFWMEPVKEVLEETDAKVVFLGDYLSCYPYEWEEGVDYNRVSIDRFKEIIKLKKDYPDRMVLLLGNHDCSYAIGPDLCECRTDYKNYNEIEQLFKDNRKLFQVAEEIELGGRKIIFSHAGILKGWVRNVWGDEADEEGFNVVDELNNAWLTDHYGILNALGDYDKYRGWGGFKYGSPVWADIRSWYGVKVEDTYGYNIVGHSQLQGDVPLVFEHIADLDCRKAFYLDEDGNIRDYNTDEKYDALEALKTDDNE